MLLHYDQVGIEELLKAVQLKSQREEGLRLGCNKRVALINIICAMQAVTLIPAPSTAPKPLSDAGKALTSVELCFGEVLGNQVFKTYH